MKALLLICTILGLSLMANATDVNTMEEVVVTKIPDAPSNRAQYAYRSGQYVGANGCNGTICHNPFESSYIESVTAGGIILAAVTEADVDELLDKTEDLIDAVMGASNKTTDQFVKNAEKLEDMLDTLENIENAHPGRFSGVDGKINRIKETVGEFFNNFWEKTTGPITGSQARKLGGLIAKVGAGFVTAATFELSLTLMAAYEALQIVKGVVDVGVEDFNDYVDSPEVQSFLNPFNPNGLANPFSSWPEYQSSYGDAFNDWANDNPTGGPGGFDDPYGQMY